MRYWRCLSVAFGLYLVTFLPLGYATEVELRVLGTTDVHGYVFDFDYYKDQSIEKFGLVRTATLIKQARQEATNVVLLDSGDFIQGNPLTDLAVEKGIQPGELHPMIKAMNALNYTVVGLGNHEFNYGLNFLTAALKGAKFPVINSNVYHAKTNTPYFTPYLIIDTPVIDKEGQSHQLRIGYLNVVPPQILRWDSLHLQGKIDVQDMLKSIRYWQPILRQQGADVVVLIAHSGLFSPEQPDHSENAMYYLSQVKGIDAILFGHAHGVFPSQDYAHIAGTDIEKGTIHGIPAVMPGQWGSHLGVIDLVLEKKNEQWKVVKARSEARPIFDDKLQKSLVKRDEALVTLMDDEYQQTRAYVAQPIGRISKPLFSYLALVQGDPTIQVVNQAQRDYVKRHLAQDPNYNQLPILAVMAPFKAGGRKNDPQGYIEIAQGPLSLRHAADLYLFSNILVTLKVSGHDVKEWLECTAGMFNQIDSQSDQPQYLLNWSGFRTYLFDVMSGVNYQIDVTQPPRYDGKCRLINPQSERIVNLTYQGKPIDKKRNFLVVTNNYRAYSGAFSGTGKENIVFSSPDDLRTIVIEYIQSQTKQHGDVLIEDYHNWQFLPIKHDQNLDIRFETASSDTATSFVQQDAQYPMTFIERDSTGFAVYRIDLTHK